MEKSEKIALAVVAIIAILFICFYYNDTTSTVPTPATSTTVPSTTQAYEYLKKPRYSQNKERLQEFKSPALKAMFEKKKEGLKARENIFYANKETPKVEKLSSEFNVMRRGAVPKSINTERFTNEFHPEIEFKSSNLAYRNPFVGAIDS